MKNKKIDLIVKYFYPVAAGIETNTLETYSILAKEGFNVIIHTSINSLVEKNIYKNYEEYRGLKIKRFEFNKYLLNPKIDYKNSDIIALHNFDVLPHLTIMLKSLFFKILGKKNYKLILTPHGGFNPEWSIFKPQIALAKSIYHFTLGTFLINLTVDSVRAVSEWERQEIIKKGVNPSKVVVISNGLEDEAFKDVENLASNDIKQKVKSFGKYIIQIGRVYPIKNYETTIKALAKCPKDLKYIIAGPIANENYKTKLDNLIKKLNLKNRVIFVGVIRGIDKYYLIKHAQIMVHMAIWESFCNVVHEGLSQGLPIIVANNTALPYIIKNNVNGYCVETKNYQKLASKIDFILKNMNGKEIKDMKKRNKNVGTDESWTSTALKMKELYEK
ncbi:glycosyltransferase family 4 protein [Candidatus Woesebacteria bacterium]|nr:glycosyltransferase family 4 protein [Candidatus Woesebacteria bacterium]QQG47193.1 MAG: glycosyltransferase family 4 protein [Candidatus Woesebacteria bacterium]